MRRLTLAPLLLALLLPTLLATNCAGDDPVDEDEADGPSLPEATPPPAPKTPTDVH